MGKPQTYLARDTVPQAEFIDVTVFYTGSTGNVVRWESYGGIADVSSSYGRPGDTIVTFGKPSLIQGVSGGLPNQNNVQKYRRLVGFEASLINSGTMTSGSRGGTTFLPALDNALLFASGTVIVQHFSGSTKNSVVTPIANLTASFHFKLSNSTQIATGTHP